MKKILILLSIFSSVSFSDSNIKIFENDFYENEKKSEIKSINISNREDTKIKVIFSNKYKSLENKEEFEELLKHEVLSYGNGKKDFFVFVDPACKFCRAFAKDSMEHLEDGTYHIILLPLDKHKTANKMISFILHGDTNKERFKRFKSVLVEEKFDEKKYLISHKDTFTKTYIEKIKKLTKKKNIKATPTFYEVNNNIHRISWTSFNEKLDS